MNTWFLSIKTTPSPSFRIPLTRFRPSRGPAQSPGENSERILPGPAPGTGTGPDQPAERPTFACPSLVTWFCAVACLLFGGIAAQAVNTPPTISAIADHTIPIDTSVIVPFTIADLETAASGLLPSVSSSNPTLVPASRIVLRGVGASCSLLITPMEDTVGSTVITVRVTDADAATTTRNFLLTVVGDAGPPVIIEQPRNQAVGVGMDATFSVTARGARPLRYAWYREGLPIPGATAPVLLLRGVQHADAGTYWVVVANALGSVRSADALLFVTNRPCVEVSCPTNIVVPCTGPEGARVPFELPAVNACTGESPTYQSADHHSGDLFPIGRTDVHVRSIYTVRGSVFTNDCEFSVTVEGGCPAKEEVCLDLSSQGVATLPNPWEPPGFKLETFYPFGGSAAENHIVDLAGYLGLWVEARLDIELSEGFPGVALEVFRFGADLDIVALDVSGVVVDTRSLRGDGAELTDTVHLGSRGAAIRRIRLTASGGPVLLLSLCGRPLFNDVALTEHCRALAELPPGPVPNPWSFDGLTLTSWRYGGVLDPQTRIDDENDDGLHFGYYVQFETEVRFDVPCRRVLIEYYENSGLIDFAAYGYGAPGALLASAHRSTVTPEPVTVELVSGGELIRRVMITSPNARTVIRRICAVTETNGACVDLTTADAASATNPYVQDGIVFWRRTADGTLLDGPLFGLVAGEQGFQLAPRAELELSNPCAGLQLTMRGTWTPLTVEAFDLSDVMVFRDVIVPPMDPATVVTLAGTIKRVVLTGGGTNTILTRVCCAGDGGQPNPTSPVRSVGGAGLSATAEGDLLIENLLAKGLAGVSLALDNPTRIRLRFDQSIPADTTPLGAVFDLKFRGENGETTIRSVDVGKTYRTTVDFQAMGSPTHALRLYDNGQLSLARSGRSIGLNLGAQPALIEMEHQKDGQLRVSFEWDAPIYAQIEPNLSQWITRLDFLTERANILPVCLLCQPEMRWSGINRRVLRPAPLDCWTVLVPENINLACAAAGTRVTYSARSFNECTRAEGPAVRCWPPSGSPFPQGETLVMCIANPEGSPIFGFFHVRLSDEGSSCYLRNGSFEKVTPAIPVAERPFAGVSDWIANGEAKLFGRESLVEAPEGTNYACLIDKWVAPYVPPSLEGRLLATLSPRHVYDVSAQVRLGDGPPVGVQLVLSDGDPTHDQVVQTLIVTDPERWHLIADRVVARFAFDRVIVRTLVDPDLGPSNGSVYVDDVRICCFGDLLMDGGGNTDPTTGSRTMSWTGPGKIQKSTSLAPNAVWEDVTLPVETKMGRHHMVIPIEPNRPAMFFQLRRD